MVFSEADSLIKSTIHAFDLSCDKNAIARINETLSRVQQARDERIRKTHDALSRLSRRLGTLTTQLDDISAVHEQANHASHIARLDTVKFRTAKAASDAEAEAERLAGQAADLAARLEELELEGVEGGLAQGQGGSGGRGGDAVDDEVLLRLKLYRSLGIDIERDQEGGEWTRAVVRNDRKGDVHVVNMDKKFSRFFYANYFWQML
ncbi:hypothetical protein CDD81_4233 [Ophiocordyceps australis]|uniref:Kinetochore protein Spc24 n=1 Tax=Ophiocordyceps australis TaxID=1399860 RepID=A0A2C5YBJ2_9HYPO|nr:hypothetical protein CDD81_4233 [Ophiocordyceps australis]